MNHERLVEFRTVYTDKLAEAVTKYPEDYGWPVEYVPTVVDKMMAAIEYGSFSKVNKNSRSIINTCKALGIKCTYKAMIKWLNS